MTDKVKTILQSMYEPKIQGAKVSDWVLDPSIDPTTGNIQPTLFVGGKAATFSPQQTLEVGSYLILSALRSALATASPVEREELFKDFETLITDHLAAGIAFDVDAAKEQVAGRRSLADQREIERKVKEQVDDEMQHNKRRILQLAQAAAADDMLEREELLAEVRPWLEKLIGG